jgi:NhaA family Na+:H+ antiporter
VSKPIPESKFLVRKAPIRQLPFIRPIVEFTRLEASSGIVLILVTILALVWANSAYADTYFQLWETYVSLSFGEAKLSLSLHHLITDGLMAIFFLLVGLEIKREFVMGELSSLKQATLPLMAALGGMLLPAVIYLLFNKGQPTESGWGVPVATDIAFTLGVITLLGKRVPFSLKVFLTAFAIADDIGAVLIIAFFYSHDLNVQALASVGVLCAVLAGLNVGGVRQIVPYLVVGAFLWYAMLQSGVHATVAGILLALFIPMKFRMNTREFLEHTQEQLKKIERENPAEDAVVTEQRHYRLGEIERACERASMPLVRLEHALHPWVSFGIMPIFALANAGVSLSGFDATVFTHPVYLGVTLGLFVGKSVGITLFSFLAVKLGLAELPRNCSWAHIFGAGVLGGIGFTMSLFIANLGLKAHQLDEAKAGILSASLISAVVGLSYLAGISRRPARAIDGNAA